MMAVLNQKSIADQCAQVCATLCRVIERAATWSDIEAATTAIRRAQQMAKQMEDEERQRDMQSASVQLGGTQVTDQQLYERYMRGEATVGGIK